MTDFYIKWLYFGILTLHVFKTIFNWAIYNNLNPERKVEPGIDPLEVFSEKDHVYKSMERNVLLYYCVLVPFWIKIPKQTGDKILAWSVLVLSIMQGIGVYLLLKLKNYI